MAKAASKLHPAQKFVVERIHRSKFSNAPYNPRGIDAHNRKKLYDNIKNKGLLEPIVWNRRTGNLVGGHQRLSILDDQSKTGGDYVLDVSVVDLSEKEEKEQNVFFNNPSTQGRYDGNALGKMIVDDDADYRAMGFDDMDIQLELEGTDYAVTMFDDDAAPKSVQDDLDKLEEIQRMRRERKEHRSRDQDANDPEFYAVVVFPDREAQGRFMERVGMGRNDRYVDGVRLHTSLEASRPKTRTEGGETFEAMTFWLAKDQKAVIEAELTRIASMLKGKNIRGRALEVMAEVSAQTPTDNIAGDDKPTSKFKTSKNRR